MIYACIKHGGNMSSNRRGNVKEFHVKPSVCFLLCNVMDLQLLILLNQSLHISLQHSLYACQGSSAWLSLSCIVMRRGYLVILHHSTLFSNFLHSSVFRWPKFGHNVLTFFQTQCKQDWVELRCSTQGWDS